MGDQQSIAERKARFAVGKRSVKSWLAVLFLFISACTMGPSMMRVNRLTYNDAVQLTERQELLLNIIRLRYNEGPEFLTTSSISTQFAIDLGATAGAQLGDDQEQRTELLDIGGTIGYSERPTITFTPRNEKEFTRQLISPIELEIIFLLVNYGWDLDRVLRLTTEGINGLRNETIREDPSEYYYLQLREFAQIAKKLGRLQHLGLVEISFDQEEIDLSGPISADKVNLSDILEANKDDYKLLYQAQTDTYRLKKIARNMILRFSKNALELPELQQVVNRLNLESGVQTFRILNAPGSQIKASELTKNSKELVLSTRSVLGTMAYLSQGVSVPGQHLEAGLVSVDFGGKTTQGIIFDLFQVKVQKEKPKHAGLGVPFKGYWFYIDEKDISSKRTIGALNSLMRLKIRATGAQTVPVLTLPVGN